MKDKNKNLKKLELILSIIILIIANIIFCISYYIITILKEVNFYELLYYFSNDTSGTGPSIIIDGIKSCFFVFILLMILLIFPISKINNTNIYVKLKNKKKTIYPTIFNKYKLLYSLIILALSIIVIGKTINFDEYYENSRKSTYIYEKYYVDTNKTKIEFPNKKRNLILLYLESMESSLVSKENGGAFEKSIIPELETLALENLNFSNTNKIGGAYNLSLTSWTMASTVATTTGTPIYTKKNKGSKNENKFMPNINALGDVLKENGYNLEIIQGSDINFSGVDEYYKTHGNYKMFDLNTAKEKGYISENYYKWWGYEDSKLFEYSKKEIEELASKDEPFAISIFTMDTHFKDGYLDESCPVKYDNKLSNVYACSSYMINEFMSWLKIQDFYENTTIVVIGDHLTMQNEYYNDYPDYNRTIYNAFINSVNDTTNNKNREFSSLDLYPTILSSIGAKIEGNKLGFGVNLFSDEKTMIEILGKEIFDTELLKYSKYYKEQILKDVLLDTLGHE